MSVKYSLQIGKRDTVFIVIADTIAFWLTLLVSLYASKYFDLSFSETFMLLTGLYLLVYNLPAYLSRGRSWGMLLYEVDVFHKGEPLSAGKVLLRAVLFLPVYCSSVVSLFGLNKENYEHQIDPLFDCYGLRQEGIYLNQ